MRGSSFSTAMPDAVEFGEHVGASRLVRDQELAPVADRLRPHMLVGRRVLDDGGRVDARLGRERALAHIGQIAVGSPVEDLVERARHVGQARQLVVGDPDLELLGISRLELEVADQRNEVGIAAAFAEAVEGALDLARAGPHRGEGIRDRLLGVVMGVDADVLAGNGLDHRADDRLDLMGQRSAICVAQHDPARARLIGRLGAGERILRIGLVAVEEMLAVEQHFPALRGGGAYAVADRGEIVLERRLQRDAHMIVGRLRDEADRVGVGGEETGKPRVVGNRAAGPPRHAEGREGRAQRPLGAEQFGVGRVRAGIAALDVIDAEIVEQAGDRQLVMQREVDAVGLRAVAQRGVEEIDAFATRHGIYQNPSPAMPVSPIAEELQRDRDRDRDDDDLDRDVVEPMAGKRGLGMGHGTTFASLS